MTVRVAVVLLKWPKCAVLASGPWLDQPPGDDVVRGSGHLVVRLELGQHAGHLQTGANSEKKLKEIDKFFLIKKNKKSIIKKKILLI
jgi:hypothetical protein